MKKSDFYLLIDQAVEAEPGTIKGGEQLADIIGWDSLAVIGFIAGVDKHFGLPVSAAHVASAKTVDDLANLVEGHLAE